MLFIFLVKICQNVAFSIKIFQFLGQKIAQLTRLSCYLFFWLKFWLF